MKKNLNNIASIVFILLGGVLPVTSFAATSPTLGSSGTYGITSSTFTNSNTALETAIVGDVCYSVAGAPVTPPISITGATVAPCDPARGTDLSGALADLNGQACTLLGNNIALDAVTISGFPVGTFPPGCYSTSGAMTITLSTTVTLSGAGTYIFKSGGALTTGANSFVSLTNGASANNVFWAPIGLASLGANSATSLVPTFVGNILDAAGISLGHFANLLGRALAFGGTVTTDANTITVPSVSTSATLNVIKHVINDNGGTSLAGAWTLTVSSSNGGTGTGSAVGAESLGTAYTLQAGKAYSVAESGGPAGYSESASSDCVIANAVANTTYTCTITNDDIAPQLTVTKIVVNGNGGTKVVSNFSLFIDGQGVTSGVASTTSVGAHTVSETADAGYTPIIGGHCASNGAITLVIGDAKVCTITNTYIPLPAPTQSSYFQPMPLMNITKIPTPLALPNGPGSVTFTYTLTNIGVVPIDSVWVKDDKCSSVAMVSGDINNDLVLDLTETWVYFCTKLVTETEMNTATTHGRYGGGDVFDTASATVVVGTAVVGVVKAPPLIHLVKKPNIFLLPAVGGVVTYSYAVTNPGSEPLSDVSIVDDKCTGLPGRVIGHPGDLNKNDLLESNESWAFTCQSNLTKTTTNIGTVVGYANGLMATDFSPATVVVSAPSLPITGFPPFGGGGGKLSLLFDLFGVLFGLTWSQK